MLTIIHFETRTMDWSRSMVIEKLNTRNGWAACLQFFCLFFCFGSFIRSEAQHVFYSTAYRYAGFVNIFEDAWFHQTAFEKELVQNVVKDLQIGPNRRNMLMQHLQTPTIVKKMVGSGGVTMHHHFNQQRHALRDGI